MAEEKMKYLRVDLRDLVRELNEMSPEEQEHFGWLLQEMGKARQRLCELERGIADALGGS